jgi:hypothetical protein
MKKELFDQLIEAVKEGAAILRGEQEPSRIFDFPPSSSASLLLSSSHREERPPAQNKRGRQSGNSGDP